MKPLATPQELSLESEESRLWARQQELEAEMSGQGVERYLSRMKQSQEKGREATTSYGQELLGKIVPDLIAKIEEFLKRAADPKKGRRYAALPYLQQVKPSVAAYITAKVILDTISQTNRLQMAANAIGSMIEDEVRFTAAEKQNKALFRTIARDLNRSSDYDYKRKVMIHSLNKDSIEWTAWPDTDKMLLGSKLIDLLIQTSGLVEMHLGTTTRNKSIIRLQCSAEASTWISGQIAFSKHLSPVYLPTVLPPVPWDDPCHGGYHSSRRNCRLIKTRNANYLEEFRNGDVHLVYSAINAIQGVAWKINTSVLAVMQEAWKTNSCIAGLPNQEPEPLPPKPADIAENKESRKVWKRKAHHVHDRNIKIKSKRFQAARVLQVAGMFRDDKAIYFPHQLDFRGRIYAIPMFLNPQGPDEAKALLTFANGRPIEDQISADWLAVHGANLYGQDKTAFSGRVSWVKENDMHIKLSAENPLDYRWWAKADDPWQFLAFCFEWTAFRKQGMGFVSSIPIALDGSCNGLQHFSAMLRDETGGAAVNLTPSDTPQDVYAAVADRVNEKLKADNSTVAQLWFAFGISRKITKRPVMVVPYGGTQYSCRDYIKEHVLERVAAGEVNPFGDEIFPACTYLARLVWDAISEVVVSARHAMDWLQKVSRLVSTENLPVTWTAPSGFPVLQAYYDIKRHVIKTKIGGAEMQLTVAADTKKIDRRRQAQGISPNFVHSLDAAALMFSVDAAAQCGIDSFAMIHDSYGTVAADTAALNVCLREAFIAVYQTDVLADFLRSVSPLLPEGAEVPPLPTKGTLDLNLVRESQFFFA